MLEQLIDRGSGAIIGSLICKSAIAITPSDTEDLGHVGFVMLPLAADDDKNVKVMTVGGQVVTLNLLHNQIIPLLVKRVYSTGTSATSVETGVS